jgi:hypothetical protein
MDVVIALLLIVFGALALILLFFATWILSLVLIASPRWVGDQIVLRYWPERTVDGRALRNYRIAGFILLVLSVLITIPPVLRLWDR